MTTGAEPIPISALQHAVYCLRQAALIHLEQMWAENRFTAEGDVLHAVTDKGGSRSGRGVRRVHALALSSVRLNLTGVADLVEFSRGPGGVETAFPVEYKRGKPKLHRADEVQLCAQALCLEDMTGQPVPQGALFYATTKRRVTVPFDAELRDLTTTTAADLAQVLASGMTPPPTTDRRRCRACSLIELCRPDTVARPVRAWRRRQVSAALGDDL
ncbi:MAG: CRISPR-associated protein Cas4 [Paracoccus sp. (in: a-proteobacteria)]|uniref:CRISPR-associated protein Cas4 n=1 Tax=Paracoccus sp. TaxID=267 RepID=UPI0026DF3EBE|nr:CRISPR-associated protein Cas4 [Paracoccus sp. (in: a-proteobacteria)]MDO5620643.1 CRISPR-associated protein Cas4 [Paracoccus sp. (in: a-proteobacteria)]